MKFNEEQQMSVDCRESEILVSAAAGSGKTAVLTARVIKLILEDNIPIDRLLIITFTRLATAEMRERISKALSDELNKSNSSKDKIIKQLSLLNKAYISTMDSFFSDVVKKNFKIVDIDPSFRIGEKYELDKIKKDILDEMFEEYYSSESQKETFSSLVDLFSIKSGDDSLSDVVYKIQSISSQVDDFDKWIDEKISVYNAETKDDLINSPIISSSITKHILFLFNKLKESVMEEICCAVGVKSFEAPACDDFFKYIPEFLEKDSLLVYNLLVIANQKENVCKPKNETEIINFIISYDFSATFELTEEVYEKLCKYIGSYKFARINKKALSDENTASKIDSIRKKLKNNVFADSVKSFFVPLSDMAAQNKVIKNEIMLLCEIVKEFNSRFMAYKKDNSVFGFDDISHFCYEIICKNKEIAEEYQNNFDEIIIDEYQDSNHIQENIFKAIFNGKKNRRFSVGDIKQCIYTFRNSDPLIFSQKYKSSETPVKIINLNANYRSRKCVIDFANYIFKRIMSEETGGVVYDENAQLNAGFDYCSKDKGFENNISKLCEAYVCCDKGGIYESNARREAEIVAERINALKSDGFHIYDKSQDKIRPFEYRDAAVLFKSASEEYKKEFLKVLDENSIPYYLSNSQTKGFFKTSEVSLVAALLKIIDNPLCSIEFAAVLNSPIAALTADELVEIRSIDFECPLYNAANKYITDGDNSALKEKLSKFLSSLNEWRFLSVNMPVCEFISFLYYETGYYEIAGILNNSAIRKANLDLFLEQASKFSVGNTGTLFDFLQFIENIEKDNNYKTDEISVSGENENVVRIMTVHKSKGLEFPIVFIVNTNNKFNFIDVYSSNKVIADKDFGLGFFTYNYSKSKSALSKSDLEEYSEIIPKYKNEHFYRSIIKENIKSRLISEEMRVLYVAATRAREKLIFVSVYKRQNENSFLSWLLPVFEECAKENKDFFKYEHIITEESDFEEAEPERCKEAIQEENSECFSGILKSLISFENYIALKEKEEKLSSLLDWQYSCKQDTLTSSTTSVSEIKKNHIAMLNDTDISESDEISVFSDDDFKFPKFSDKDKSSLASAEIGTAYHTVMEHLDFSLTSSQDVTKLLKSLCEKNILTAEQADSIKISKIVNFLNSDICRNNIRNSKNIKREQAFAMQISPQDVYKDDPQFLSCKKKMLVHGIIDLYYEAADGSLVLLDYKTDYFKKETEMLEKYSIQLKIYKSALEKATNKKVSEVYLYLFNSDSALKANI